MSETVEVLIERAHNVVSELCEGKRSWTMSVPARPEEDPDLVITAALRAAKDALATAETRIRQDKERLDWLDNAYGPYKLEMVEDRWLADDNTSIREAIDRAKEADEC